jgi:isocitrate/isopropylmalate dehydrogenase
VKLLVLPGDGIGPEITDATLAVVDATDKRFGLGIHYDHDLIGFPALEKYRTTFPDHVRAKVAHNDGVILGPVSHLDYPPRDQGGINPSGEFRVKWDLYANVRPAKSRLGLSRVGKPMDLVIMRQCTEGFYADRNMFMGVGEFMPTPDMALAVRKVTAEAARKIAVKSFELARTRRKKVTVVHKQNVMKMSDGLWLREARAVAAQYPDVQVEEKIVDAMAALLVRDPSQFDVIMAENMFGDILSDEAGELSGSLGLAGSTNEGDDYCVAQAQHGSAPDIAGKGIANPTSLILSAAMLFEWYGRRNGLAKLTDAAAAIERAIDSVLIDPQRRTGDLGGPLGTRAFTTEVVRAVASV